MRNAPVLRPLLVLGLGLSATLGLGAPATAAQDAGRYSERAVVSIFGETGDPVTAGTPRAWHSGRDAVSVTRSGEGIRVTARSAGQDAFEILLLPKPGEQFTYGGFFDARPTPTAGHPTLKVAGGAHSCRSGSSGHFRVLDNSPSLSRLWILFEQRCAGAPGSSFGEIRLNVDQDRSLLVSPVRIEFPQHDVGTEGVTVPVTFFNIGSEAITFGTPQVVGRPTKTPTTPVGDDPFGAAGTVSFQIRGTTCTTLQPGASCEVLVAYRPVVPGPVEASLAVPDSTPAGGHQTSLAGFTS